MKKWKEGRGWRDKWRKKNREGETELLMSHFDMADSCTGICHVKM